MPNLPPNRPRCHARAHTRTHTHTHRFTSRADWEDVYAQAFTKMINTNAAWATRKAVVTTGTECFSGFWNPNDPTAQCGSCTTTGGGKCPAGCVCK